MNFKKFDLKEKLKEIWLQDRKLITWDIKKNIKKEEMKKPEKRKK